MFSARRTGILFQSFQNFTAVQLGKCNPHLSLRRRNFVHALARVSFSRLFVSCYVLILGNSSPYNENHNLFI